MPQSQTRIVGGVAVFVPTGAIGTAAHALAPRLNSLRGMRIGILDNCKEFADIVLRGVADVLQREHGAQVTLPFVVAPHPVGDCDTALIKKRGADIAAQCMHRACRYLK